MTCLEAPSPFAKSCKIEERTTQTNVILFDTFRLPFTREHDSKIQKASNCQRECHTRIDCDDGDFWTDTQKCQHDFDNDIPIW